MTIEITEYDGLNFTPALPIAARGWMELMDAGLVQNCLLLGLDQKAFTYSIDGIIAGVLVFEHHAYRKEVFVILGYVLPEYRRTGVYRALWLALVEKAKDLKCHHITSGTAAANESMRSAAAALGRSERSVWLHFDV